jgi:hypothetical protein
VGGSLTIALAMILFGAALIYAGWTNRPLKSLLTGDNSTKRAG